MKRWFPLRNTSHHQNAQHNPFECVHHTLQQQVLRLVLGMLPFFKNLIDPIVTYQGVHDIDLLSIASLAEETPA